MIKKMLFALVFFGSICVRADSLIIRGTKIYSVPSKSIYYSLTPTEKTIKAEKFLKLERKTLENAHANFFPTSIEESPEAKWFNKIKKPKVPVAEGCGKYPMEWLVNSHEVAELIKPMAATSLLIQVPAEFKATKSDPSFENAFKKYLMKDANNERVTTCMKTIKFFEKGEVRLAYIDCDDGLNEIERIFVADSKKHWTIQDSYVLTDNCP